MVTIISCMSYSVPFFLCHQVFDPNLAPSDNTIKYIAGI